MARKAPDDSDDRELVWMDRDGTHTIRNYRIKRDNSSIPNALTDFFTLKCGSCFAVTFIVAYVFFQWIV